MQYMRSTSRVQAIAIGALLLTCIATAAFGTTGEDDPVGPPSRYTIFHDDELLVPMPGQPVRFETWEFNSSLEHQLLSNVTQMGFLWNTNTNHLFAAAGHIIDPHSNEVAYIRRSDDLTSVQVAIGPYYSHTSVVTLPDLVSRYADSADFMDIAVSDLDKVADDQGNNHDEVVVVWASPASNGVLHVQVAVLDYTGSAPNNPQPTAVTTATATQTSTPWYITPVDNILGVTIGDINGDGQNDIAVVHLSTDQTMWATIFRYTNDGQGHHVLTEVSTLSDSLPSADFLLMGTVDVIAGDFNGDGKDELAVGRVDCDPVSDDTCRYNLLFSIVQSDASLQLTIRGRFKLDPSSSTGSGPVFADSNDISSRPRLQLVAGLFKFEPPGYDLSRRQFAAVWNPPAYGGGLGAAAFDVSNDLQTMSLLGMLNLNFGPIYHGFGVAAGGFRGHQRPDDPRWSLAVSGWEGSTSNNPSSIVWGVFDVPLSQNSIIYGRAQSSEAVPVPFDTNARLPLVAFDADGDAFSLGAPIRFTISQLQTTDAIIQEPPKHGDWIPGSGWVNVSILPDYAIAMSTSTGTEYSSAATTTSDHTLSGSLAVSAKETIEQGIPLLGSVQVTAEQESAFEKSFSEKQSDYAQNSSTYSFKLNRETNKDDLIAATFRDLFVWRYPVLGFTTTDASGTTLTPYYEIVIPGPVYPLSLSGGKNFAWYQPQHENGNLLSYPQLSSTTPGSLVEIPDLGSYQLPGDSAPRQQWLLNLNYFVDADALDVELEIEDTQAATSERESSREMKESVDVKVSAETKVHGVGLEVAVDTAISNANSWTNLNVSEYTTTSAQSFTLTIPDGILSSQAYQAATAYYYATDGTQKVIHAVDLLASAAGQDFWLQHYGGRPDPALNLSNKFNIISDNRNEVKAELQWNPEYSRQKIRGFFVLHNDPNNPAELGAPAAHGVTTGEQVTLQVRVYNYSLTKAAQNVEIAFWAVAIDTLGSNSGALIPLCDLGSTCPYATIAPLSMQTVELPWVAVGPTTPDTSQDYRIFVVLDPQNTIANEIHEWQDRYHCAPTVEGCASIVNGDAQVSAGDERLIDPFTGEEERLETGQNNQGFGEFTVHAPPTAASLQASARLRRLKAQQGLLATGPDIHLRREALTGRHMQGQFQAQRMTARMDQPMQLHVAVHTDERSLRQHHVVVYDGDPDAGGELIAATTLHGVVPNGSYVWVDWVPRTPGQHQIWARVVEKEDDSQPDNHVARLQVDVQASAPASDEAQAAPATAQSSGGGCAMHPHGDADLTSVGMLGLVLAYPGCKCLRYPPYRDLGPKGSGRNGESRLSRKARIPPSRMAAKRSSRSGRWEVCAREESTPFMSMPLRSPEASRPKQVMALFKRTDGSGT